MRPGQSSQEPPKSALPATAELNHDTSSSSNQATDDEPTAKDPGTPKPATNSTLLSLPLEVRLMILAICIVPSRVKKNCGTPYYKYGPMWYLSHTVPRSTLRLSKQLRTEAFTALASYPGFTVICNTWPDCSPRNGAHSPTTGNMTVLPEKTLHDLRRVYRQCENLPAPKGRKLTLRLFGKYALAFNCLEKLKSWWVDQVLAAVEFWPEWESVFIDPPEMNRPVVYKREEGNVQSDPHVEMVCRVIVEGLRPLRARTATMKVGLKGWPEDTILKELEKGEGTDHL